MALLEQLNADLKAALKSGDEVRKRALRQVLAGAKQARLDKRTAQAQALRKRQAADLTEAQLAALDQIALDDADITAVLQKEAKSRRESMADAEKAGRPDLLADNAAELKVLEGYLPQLLTRAELVEMARAAIAEAGVTDLKGQGAVMKILAPRTRGRADGKLVSDVVRELLNG
jgi:uncharacterized protein YqeY